MKFVKHQQHGTSLFRKMATKIPHLLSKYRIPILIFFVLGPLLILVQNLQFWKLYFMELFTPRAMDLPPFFKNQDVQNISHSIKMFSSVPSPCELQDDGLLILITSARSHKSYRQIYRQVYQNIPTIQVKFLIGLQKSDETAQITHEIMEEDKAFHDMVIGNVEDNYDNLKYKKLSGYTYVQEYCQPKNNTWVFFLDDDTTYDIERARAFMNKGTEPTVICAEKLAHKFTAQRSGKYKVDLNAWPIGYYYPDYCLGSCTIMSTRRAHVIAEQGRKTHFGLFTMEDILFTGIMRINAQAGELTDARGVCSHADNKSSDTLQKLKQFYEKYCRDNNYESCEHLFT